MKRQKDYSIGQCVALIILISLSIAGLVLLSQRFAWFAWIERTFSILGHFVEVVIALLLLAGMFASAKRLLTPRDALILSGIVLFIVFAVIFWIVMIAGS